jgi:hypothetical protein
MVLSGVISQQMANQPGAAFDTGLVTPLPAGVARIK